jgi:hypothetical protein
MWNRRRGSPGGPPNFFIIALSHDNIENYYRLNFSIIHNTKTFTLTELENMMPYEREIYISLLESAIQEENDKIARQNAHK